MSSVRKEIVSNLLESISHDEIKILVYFIDWIRNGQKGSVTFNKNSEKKVTKQIKVESYPTLQ